MSLIDFGHRAKRGLIKAADSLHGHHVGPDEIAEIEAAQRYRTMIGIEQPIEERTARARKNAARTSPLTHKTW